MTKCGYVAIVGKPNTGKSTILNKLLNQHLSVVTSKAQTTRNKIAGILSRDNFQIVFLDTPGLLVPKYELQKFMANEIKLSVSESDVILFVIDAEKFNDVSFLRAYKGFIPKIPKSSVLIAVNKIDAVIAEKTDSIIRKIQSIAPESMIIPVSALKELNTETLLEKLVAMLPESPFYYGTEAVSDKSEKFFVSEIIREKVLKLFAEEIPYSVFVNVREFKERDGHKDFINADIIVERESQKIIIIGRRGEKIKKLGELARKSIEKFLGKQIYLELFVKIKKDWRKDKRFLKENFGKE
jgi:GTPase